MITIRHFTPDDQNQVSEMVLQIMNEEYREAASVYPSGDIENIPTSYGGLGEAFFVAQNGVDIVGTVAIKKEDERVALLRRLFVAPSYRKQQIGMKLIDHALYFCQEVGYKEIIFKTTSTMVGAAKICQKKGFIQRAKINLGATELLKFSLSLRNGIKSKAV